MQALAVDPSGTPLLAAGSEHGHLSIRNLATGEVAARAMAHPGDVSAILFGTIRNERVLVSGSWDATVRVWKLDFTEVLSVDVNEDVQALTWCGPERIAVGTRRGVILLELNGDRIAV